ncbi:MAG: UvrD-helicase domain-containing protein [Terriglobales bacterium]
MTSDVIARQRALDVRRSFIVQAPAGSGKTELLIQRFLALLANVEEPEAVVAITFTRKAAGEMRNRILKAFDEAAAGVPVTEPHEKLTRALAEKVLARDRQCGWNLRLMPARLRIQTIDSLCAALAHAAPSLSGFGGMPDVTDTPDDLYAAAAHATVLLLGSDSPEDEAAVRRLLEHLDNDVAVVEGLLVGMLRLRDQWLRHVHDGSDSAAMRRSLDNTLERITCRCLKRLRDAMPRALSKQLVELARYAASQRDPASPVAACRDLARLPGAAVADRAAWEGIARVLLTANHEWRSPRGINASMGFRAGTPQRKQLQALLEELRAHDELLAAFQELRALPPARFDDAQWPVIEALFRLLPRAVEQLQQLFAERGQVDFAEVAQAALRAVEALPAAEVFTAQHLLVDEYQDTSVTQQALLERLTSGWRPGDGRTLFLVGDPMQSIYRFRQAEVGLFVEAAQQHRIGRVPLEPLTLAKNFRSQKGIVEWVNDAFAQVFPPLADIARSAVSYSPAVPVKPAVAIRAVEVHPFTGPNRDVEADEAEKIISLIAAARERNPDGTIAVLVRARTHLLELVPRLREKARTDPRFRFRAVEIDTLGERQIVLDLASLTRALLQLADRLAWLSILRAPWCGLGLRDLHALCVGDETTCAIDLLRQRRDRLTPGGQQRIGRVLPVLDTALAARGRQSLAAWVRGTWLALGGPACASGTDLQDAATFFDLLEELASAGELRDWARFDQRISELFAHPDVAADGKLQLMTIHKAKGLEFDTVIVPGLGRRPRQPESPLLLWMERAVSEGDTELLLAPIKPRGGEHDPLYKYIQSVQRERAQEEQKRLLYVAATRARTELHLLGNAEVGDAGLKKPPSDSLLAHLWPVVKAQFEAAYRAWKPKEQTATVELAAAAAVPQLTRVPAPWEPPACPPALAASVDPPAPGEQVTFDWASDTVRHIGTVTHALLHKIARDGLARWTPDTVARHAAAIRAALAQCGVAESELTAATERVQRALLNSITGEKGRWLLAPHRDARSEFAISGIGERSKVCHLRLDRTFVDESGVRWIIDYKTGEREGAGRDTFADQEVARYREQLQQYARLMAQFDDRPIRLALYFPLMDEWRELTNWRTSEPGN